MGWWKDKKRNVPVIGSYFLGKRKKNLIGFPFFFLAVEAWNETDRQLEIEKKIWNILKAYTERKREKEKKQFWKRKKITGGGEDNKN